MKNRYSLLSFLVLSLTASTIVADTLPPLPEKLQQQDTQKYIHSEVGVNAFFARSIDSYYFFGNPKKVTVKDTHSFTGICWEYDRLKPNSFYSGTSGTIALGDSNQKVYLGHHKKKEFNRSNDYWMNADFGIGYNYQPAGLPNTLISVFAGPGSHGERRWNHPAHWWYGMMGLKATQAFSKGLSVGASLKTLYSFDVKDARNVTTLERKGQDKFWGMELALPISWRFGDERKIDLSLKPYLLKFNINSSETILGSRAELGVSY